MVVITQGDTYLAHVRQNYVNVGNLPVQWNISKELQGGNGLVLLRYFHECCMITLIQ